MSTRNRQSQQESNSRDRELLARVADRDKHAFDQLFQKYQPLLLRFVYRLTSSYRMSEEIVSDILYVVWDKAARIEFVRAVRGPVHAVCRVTPEDEQRIRAATDGGEKHLAEFTVEIHDAEERVVAVVHKVLHIRKRRT